MIEFRGRLILLDIEGTVSPLAFVHDVLFPFARREVGDFLTRHQTSPEVLRALEQIARDSGPGSNSEGDRTNLESESERAAWVTRIHALMDADAKQTGLKWLQGLIWDEGYQSGELKSVLFSDAVESIRAWHRSGLRLHIYSSGSIAAQRLFFAYSDSGDWTGCLEGYHDTTTGPKRAVASYQAIVAGAGLPANEILFLSDITEELDAALEAGCQTAWVVRPGNKPGQTDRHPTIRSFAEIQIS
jgi:enolase-phosphatase E1